MGTTIVGAALCVASFGSGCAPPSSVRSSISSSFRAEEIRPLAVVPLRAALERSDEPIFKNVRVQPEAPDLLTRLLFDELKNRGDDDLVPMEAVRAAMARASADLLSGPLDPLAVWIGKEVHAGSVISGEVSVYEERVGGPYGVERPAFVGIDLVLIRTSTQDTLWKAAYYEKQLSLSADIRNFPLYIRRGGKWVRAEELARYGIEEMLKSLPATGTGGKR